QKEMEDHFSSLVLRYGGIPLNRRPLILKIPYNRKSQETVAIANEVLVEHLPQSESLEDTCHLVYTAAIAVGTVLGMNIECPMTNGEIQLRDKQERVPAWRRRIGDNINRLRAEIGILVNFLKDPKNTSKKVTEEVKKIRRKLKLREKQKDYQKCLTLHLDFFKQKTAVYGARIRHYNEANKRRQQNFTFTTNQKKFYRLLEEKGKQGNEEVRAPEPYKMHRFWSHIWENPVKHDRGAFWLQEEENSVADVAAMENLQINPEDLKAAMKRMLSWKSPGMDHIQNYWWKYFTSTHITLASQFQAILEDQRLTPGFMMEGITYMLPKNPETGQPNVMRGVTSLSVNYNKAFDLVPHSWLIHTLRMYKVNEKVIALLSTLMQMWRTHLHVNVRGQGYQTQSIRIERGIFPGDSLSPLRFCLALNPLSKMLRNSGYGYSLGRRPTVLVSHLFYMNDLKLYAKNSDQLQSMLELVPSFSKSIAMEIGVDKCTILHAKRGKLETHNNIQLLDGAEIQELEPEKHYKYLGMQQLLNINTTQIKEAVTATFKKRLKLIMKTQLNAKNKTQAVNTWASPVLVYMYGVLKWSKTTQDPLDRKVRATLKASMARLYLPRRVGGRGLLHLADLCRGQETGLHDYFLKKDLPIHQAAVQADKGYTPLFLSEEDHGFEKTTLQSRLDEWSMKSLHGRFHAVLHKDNINVEVSTILCHRPEARLPAREPSARKPHSWPRHALSGRPWAWQAQCRWCSWLASVAPSCTINLTPSWEKIKENNNKYQLPRGQHCWEQKPEPVIENERVMILWDFTLQLHRLVEAKKPGILLIQKASGSNPQKITIIDIACPWDGTLAEKEEEKISKYQTLRMDLERTWGGKAKVVPIVVGTLVALPKTLKGYLQELDVTINVQTLQKAFILRISSILQHLD
uniref:Reverse transcriptase domain-containing protein n=1 Tax=Latimeria chalumnae TaxID=7897 RepID=H3AWP0_LATCH